jgi:phosphoglycolate phosphatase-like HAD superfamily hydrolase
MLSVLQTQLILSTTVYKTDNASEPQNYMFAEMRAAVSIPKGSDILDHIYALPESEQEGAMEKIREVERKAMASQRPQPGLVALMAYLESKHMPKGICTRNFDTPVAHLLEKFLDGKKFGPIVTRDFRPPKPHPAGILHIANSWGMKDGGQSLIMVS